MYLIPNSDAKSFLKDSHWYYAVGLGVVFWMAYGFLFDAYNLIPYEVLWQTLLFTVLLYPIVEEIVFRGWIQGEVLLGRFKLNATIAGITLANFLTSLLFALLHGINQEFTWAILIFFPSLVFGYLRDRYGYLLPSILLHSTFNLGFSVLFYKGV